MSHRDYGKMNEHDPCTKDCQKREEGCKKTCLDYLEYMVLHKGEKRPKKKKSEIWSATISAREDAKKDRIGSRVNRRKVSEKWLRDNPSVK